MDPTAVLKQAKAAAGWLESQGKARVKVRIARHPEDHVIAGREDEPCFRVTLSVVEDPIAEVRVDPSSKEWTVVDGPHWMEVLLSEACEFTLSAEKPAALLLRPWKSPRRLTLVVEGTPLPAWAQRYDPVTRVEELSRGEFPTIRLVFPPLRNPPVGRPDSRIAPS